MTLITRMLEVVHKLARQQRVSRCEHLESKLDFWCPVLSFPRLLCRDCAGGYAHEAHCDHCGELLAARGVSALWCVLTFEKYGASHLQDHFVALLCERCGAGVPVSEGDAVPPAELLESERGTIFLVYRKFSEWRALRDGAPVTVHVERQERERGEATQAVD